MKSRDQLVSVLLAVVVVLACVAAISSPPNLQAQSVQVLSADPPSASQGTVNLNVLIKGKGFKRGAIAKFLVTRTTDTGGVRVNSTRFVSSTDLVANIDVADAAILSLYDIQVMNTDGRGGKGTELFSVTAKGNGTSDACVIPPPILTVATTCMDRSGCLDTSFGSNGVANNGVVAPNTEGFAGATAIQSDGRIVGVGGLPKTDGWNFAIVRYNPDGTLDSSFGDGGIVTVPLGATLSTGAKWAQAVVIQPDQKIVVAGEGFWILRLNQDGSLDQTFGTNGKTQLFGAFASSAWEVSLQSDGKIVAAGGGNGTRKARTAWHIGRLTSDGKPDSSFGNNGEVAIDAFGGGIRALIIQPIKVGTTVEERILVGGSGNQRNSYWAMGLMRLTPTGALDQSFGPSQSGSVFTDICNSDNWVEGIVLDSANNILTAGTTSVGGGRNIVLTRYSENGTLDTAFGSKKSGFIITNIFGSGYWTDWDVAKNAAMQSDGKILVSGMTSTDTEFTGHFAVVRFNADGSLDNTFGHGGAAAVHMGGGGYKIAIQPWDGKIVQVGWVTAVNFPVIRYLP